MLLLKFQGAASVPIHEVGMGNPMTKESNSGPDPISSLLTHERAENQNFSSEILTRLQLGLVVAGQECQASLEVSSF